MDENKLYNHNIDPGNYPPPDIPVEEAWAQMKVVLDSAPGNLSPETEKTAKPSDASKTLRAPKAPKHQGAPQSPKGQHLFKMPVTSAVRMAFLYGGSVLIAASAIFYFSARHGSGRLSARNATSTAVTSTAVTSAVPALKSSHIYISRNAPQREFLPNGTGLFPDQRSEIRVLQDANHNMDITVNGGAYFEGIGAGLTDSGQKGGGAVFIQAGQIKITPRHANVYAGFDSVAGISSIQVQAGSVDITDGKTSMVVMPGESVKFDEKANRFLKKQKADANISSYATHVFEFNDTPLKDAVLYIGKAYGVKVRITDNVLAGSRITTRFDNKPLNEVLDIMAYTLNFEYTLNETGKEVLIKPANGRK